MPQMAPMPWDALYIYFTVIYFVFMLLTHYDKPVAPFEGELRSLSAPSLSWKW